MSTSTASQHIWFNVRTWRRIAGYLCLKGWTLTDYEDLVCQEEAFSNQYVFDMPDWQTFCASNGSRALRNTDGIQCSLLPSSIFTFAVPSFSLLTSDSQRPHIPQDLPRKQAADCRLQIACATALRVHNRANTRSGHEPGATQDRASPG